MRANYVLGLIGSLITLTLLFELLRRRRLREKYAVFWVVVATGHAGHRGVPARRSPRPPTSSASQVPANLLFFGASMLLLGVSIHQSYEMGRLEERTRTLAEEVGLLRLEIESHHRGRAPPGRVRRGLSPRLRRCAATLRARALT